MPKFRWSKIWIIVGVLFLANIAVFISLAQAKAKDHVSLHFFDVGQGDSIYLRTPQGNDVLIDGGPDSTVLSELGRVMPFRDRQIELVILTHPHADHAAGLVEVLKRFDVKKVMFTDVSYETETYKRFLELVWENDVEIVRPKIGQRIFLDDMTVFDVLFPLSSSFDATPKDVNDASIVGRLSFGSMNVFLTGDAGKVIEDFLLVSGLAVSSEILKVGHHGSRHSSGTEFIQAVSANHSVIQVGKNSYGHPHEEVLGILEENGTEIIRTDDASDVSFRLYSDRVERF